jgi:hypothetical protein
MSRAAFRQIDITRALRAAKAAGLAVSRCEIDAEGKIILVSDAAHSAIDSRPAKSAFERWKARHDETDRAPKQRRGA